jgi:hypothetical protein
MNREWHEKHPLGKNRSVEERVRWHREHQKHCRCRPVPESLRILVDARPAVKPKTARSTKS